MTGSWHGRIMGKGDFLNRRDFEQEETEVTEIRFPVSDGFPRAARTEPRELSGELPRPNSPSPPLDSGLVLSVSGRGRRESSRRTGDGAGQCTRRPAQHWWWRRIE
ncbi:hypothetical protein SBV1_650020 [Verrucomicrobia bacterium]|nr:hypothetical protein SBV1_650020 [Verrucomicrobiota bacterium]